MPWKAITFGNWKRDSFMKRIRRTNSMKVQYGSKTIRNNQKRFSMAETTEAPQVSDISSEGCYTLLMIDPDAGKASPNSPRPGNFYLHWLIVNISAGDLNTGRQIVSYQKPTPPPGTGQHEYIFQLYEQPCSLMNGLRTPDSLSGWNLEEFLKGKSMRLLSQVSMFVGQ